MGLPSGAVRNLTRNMHYDYKQKLNKIDSQQFRNLRVPEIDWKLNEAEDLLIQMILYPNNFKNMGGGLEATQRSIDDLRTLIMDNVYLRIRGDRNSFTANLPIDYMTHLSSYATIEKGTCTATVRTTVIQHDDKAEESPFDKSSFEWREVNISLKNNTMRLNTDGTFEVTKLSLDYIRIPKYFHTAVDAVGGTYNLPDGSVLTGYQNCELPEILHQQVVDLAVLITTGDLFASFQAKQMKVQLTN